MKRKKNIVLSLLLVSLLFFPLDSPGGVLPSLKDKLRESLGDLIPLRVVVDDVRVVGGDPALASSGGGQILSLEPIRFIPPSRALYSVLVRGRRGKVGHLTVEVKYDTVVTAYVTARAISRGEILREGDIYPLPQRSSRLPAGSVTDLSRILGKRVKRNLSQGVVIRTSHLEDGTLVKRGRKVRIVVRGDGVLLTATGKLMKKGRVGETVTVLCEETRRKVTGLLVSPETVVVTL
ncbi:MAG: flagella basal body P-ring formation protein FlgA [Deltaproteobacteria bacterium]|nr:MAG: flagella basal body P-ring formation protein FlgA [Deltaproteobacteria bacterium]